MTDSFPRQQARTRNFSLGAPRSFRIAPDGQRIAFLRSKSGTDPVTCLWVLDLPADPADPADRSAAAEPERLVVDPAAIGAAADEPAQERARRERSRERAGGVVAFDTDDAVTMAAFAVAGEVYTVRLSSDSDGPHPAGARSPAIDPRPDPAGQRVAYVHEGAVRITDLASGTDTELIGPGEAGGDITYGLAEYVAAEEMGRMRGYWWAPDGSALLVARADNSGLNRWHIADPANPASEPVKVGYPAAGTANSVVSLLVARLDGSAVDVRWDAAAFPYLTTADWSAGQPMIVVQSRDQRQMRLLQVDAATGATTVLREDSDPAWLDIVPGVPARLADGRIAWTADADDTRRLLVAAAAELANGSAAPVTPPGLQVRGVLAADGDTVLLAGSDGDPAEIGVWAATPAGLVKLSAQAGLHGGTMAGGTTVLTSHTMAASGLAVTVLRGGRQIATIASMAEQPGIGIPRVELLRSGSRQLRTAVLLPSWHQPGAGKLPVLMDPYGGPHAQRVLASADAFLTSQWFADQGFAVIVADGRGTPGRGPRWDRAVAGDLAGPALADQADALAALAAHPVYGGVLDLTKVAIRGWSFGGYLAALAVLRRPDVFHAAVAGAPVTDWRLYDSHYTERYLGDPAQQPAAYDQSSLLADAHKLDRPLLIIHGLADDNVVVAHSLRLSSALLAAGRQHSVLPLSGVTHMASQEEVAENLLLLQVAFLRDALGLEHVARVTPEEAAPTPAQ